MAKKFQARRYEGNGSEELKNVPYTRATTQEPRKGIVPPVGRVFQTRGEGFRGVEQCPRHSGDCLRREGNVPDGWGNVPEGWAKVSAVGGTFQPVGATSQMVGERSNQLGQRLN